MYSKNYYYNLYVDTCTLFHGTFLFFSFSPGQHSAGAVSQHRQLCSRCEADVANRGQCYSRSAEFGSVDFFSSARTEPFDGHSNSPR